MWSIFFEIHAWSQIVILGIFCGVCLPFLIWHEWNKGNDLTYVEFFRILATCAAFGLLGPVAFLVIWILWKFALDNPVEPIEQMQHDSMYPLVKDHAVLLRGSRSAKTLRALLATDEEF